MQLSTLALHGLPDYGYTMFVLSGNKLTGKIPAEYLAIPRRCSSSYLSRLATASLTNLSNSSRTPALSSRSMRAGVASIFSPPTHNYD